MSLIFNELSLAKTILSTEKKVYDKGMTLSLETDFHEFTRISPTLPNRSEVTPIFNPNLSIINEHNGFWIKGVNAEGEITHLQAVRMERLENISLSQHLQQSRHLYCTPNIGLDPDASKFDEAPFAHAITGTVCYHGELWMSPSHGGLRSKGLASPLAQMTMAITMLKWAPDYMFCLTVPRIMRTGFSVRNGYLHMHPKGIRWRLGSHDHTSMTPAIGHNSKRNSLPVNENKRDNEQKEYFDEWLSWIDYQELNQTLASGDALY